MNIQIALIESGTRLRATDPSQVAELVESIREVGLLNPITVFRKKVLRGADWVDGFGLVAGAHRFEAAKQLGWTEIPGHVVELSDMQRDLAECDENLRGPKLSPAERARFMKRRKEAYEALHPEAKAGAVRARAANAAMGRDVADKMAPTFSADTAAATVASRKLCDLMMLSALRPTRQRLQAVPNASCNSMPSAAKISCPKCWT